MWSLVLDPEDPPEDEILLVDDQGFVSLYDCAFFKFELWRVLGTLDENNSVQHENTFGFDNSIETVTNTLSLVGDQLKTDTVIEPDGSESFSNVWNKIPSIPEACRSGNFEIDITNVSPDTIPIDQDASITIDYRYRYVSDTSDTLEVRLSGPKVPAVEGVVVEANPVVTGEIVQSSFDLIIDKASLIESNAERFQIDFGFFIDGGTSGTLNGEPIDIIVTPASAPVPNDFSLSIDSTGERSASIGWSSLTIDGDGSVLADIYINDSEEATGVTSVGWAFTLLEPDTEYTVRVVARSTAFDTTREKEITFKTKALPSLFEVTSAALRGRTTGVFGGPPTVLIRFSNRDLLESIVLNGTEYGSYSFAGDNGILITFSDEEFNALDNASVKEGVANYTENGASDSVIFTYTTE